MRKTYRHSKPRGLLARHRHLLIPLLLIVLFLLGALVYRYWLASPATEEADSSQTVSDEPVDVSEEEPVDALEPLPSVQAELDAWLEAGRGTHGVMLQDPENGDILAVHNENEPYFTASIYKLYVAYLGLMDIEAGSTDPDEPYNQGRSRQQCITEMVRDSDSPCAELMWAEQGKEASTKRLEEYGFTGTSMVALQTTAHDATLIMVRLQQQKDLNEQSEALLRGALENQMYREAIPSGAPTTTVFNKVGFYETGWLDTAIVRLPSGREVVLSIFSDGVGSREVAAITETVIAPLLAY